MPKVEPEGVLENRINRRNQRLQRIVNKMGKAQRDQHRQDRRNAASGNLIFSLETWNGWSERWGFNRFVPERRQRSANLKLAIVRIHGLRCRFNGSTVQRLRQRRPLKR